MGFILLLMAAGVVTVVLLHNAHRKKQADLLARAGRKWGGRVVPASFFSSLPRLQFSGDGVPAEVSFLTESHTLCTRVRFPSGARHRLHLTPQGATWLRNLFGSEIRIGDAAFDRAFWIESTEPAWVRTLLTPYLRQRLMHLNSLLPAGAVTAHVGPGGVMLKTARWLVEEAESLEHLIELGILLLNEVRKVPGPAGVVFASVETRYGSDCPLCGHAVKRGKTCSACATPHHEDCWKYAGGCAIYGCADRSGAAQTQN